MMASLLHPWRGIVCLHGPAAPACVKRPSIARLSPFRFSVFSQFSACATDLASADGQLASWNRQPEHQRRVGHDEERRVQRPQRLMGCSPRVQSHSILTLPEATRTPAFAS